MIDVKSMIEESSNKECMSPILAAEFQKKQEAAQATSKPKGPSFL